MSASRFAQLEEVYLEAMALEPAQRGPFPADESTWLAASFARDGRIQAAGVMGLVVSVDGDGIRSHVGHTDHVSGLVELDDSGDFVTIDYDGQCLHWEAGEPRKLVDLPGQLHAVAASTDGSRIAVGGATMPSQAATEQGSFQQRALLEFVDLTGRTWSTPRTSFTAVKSLAFEPNGVRVVACGTDSSIIESWSLDASYDGTPTTLARLSSHARAVAWSPDDALIAVGSDDGSVSIVEPDGAREPRTIGTHARRLHAVAFSPVDPTLLVSGSSDGAVRLWDARAGRMLVELLHPGSEEMIFDLEFTPDGTGALVAGDNQRLGIIRLDYFDTYIAGNMEAWLADPGGDPDGADQLRAWAARRLEEAPHPLWCGP